MPQRKKASQKKASPLELEYVHAYIPDKALVARLLQICKGNHSMAELAKVCGVSASTLSRILNGKIAKPMELELIRTIADHSAVEDADHMFDSLAKANGWIPKSIRDERENNYVAESIFRDKQDHIAMRNTIMSSLLERGYPVKIVGVQHQAIQTELPIRILSSLTVETDIGDGPFLWSFMYIMTSLKGSSFQDEKERTLMMMSGWFLEDNWEPEKLNGRRTSFVFRDASFGIMIEEDLWNLQFNNDFSIIGVDISREKITWEESFSRKDGKPIKDAFSKPVLQDELSDDLSEKIVLDFDVHTGRN